MFFFVKGVTMFDCFNRSKFLVIFRVLSLRNDRGGRGLEKVSNSPNWGPSGPVPSESS